MQPNFVLVPKTISEIQADIVGMPSDMYARVIATASRYADVRGSTFNVTELPNFAPHPGPISSTAELLPSVIASRNEKPNRILSWNDRWKELANLFSCQLLGFDEGYQATFITPDDDHWVIGERFRSVLEKMAGMENVSCPE